MTSKKNKKKVPKREKERREERGCLTLLMVVAFALKGCCSLGKNQERERRSK
jgi:hypothetical protein